MRALIITCSVWHPKLPLRACAETLVAGPGWPDAQTIQGYWRSLRTPLGDYDLLELLAKIPDYQYPELLICLGNARGSSRPRNLSAFTGRKLFLCDPSGTDRTASVLFERYLALEGYDEVMRDATSGSITAVLAAESRILSSPWRADAESESPFHPLRLHAS